MSIVTKTGDAGTTGLMFNRRVSKCHPRVEAYGSVDELNAALGLARATAEHAFVRDNLLAIQKDLVTLMGELAGKAANNRTRSSWVLGAKTMASGWPVPSSSATSAWAAGQTSSITLSHLRSASRAASLQASLCPSKLASGHR